MDSDVAPSPAEATPPLRVVWTPDVLARAFFEEPAAAALRAWRDGRIQPVIHRDLLGRYFRVLRQLGLPEVLLRRWGWWFAAPTRARLDAIPFDPGLTLAEVCDRLAGRHPPHWVVSGDTAAAPPNPQATWLSPEAFLERLPRLP